MPSYDYQCESNGQVVEVRHSMSQNLTTWGEVCETAGIELGGTPAETPVKRLITGGQVVSSSNLKDSAPPSCGSGMCGGGFCGLN